VKREVRLHDVNRYTVFHGIEANPDEWYWTEPNMSGICRGNRESLISWIDNKIGGLEYGEIEITPLPGGQYYPCTFDKHRRNLWVGGEYLAPHEYLVRLIPPLHEEGSEQ
jgi:hypothetical protein